VDVTVADDGAAHGLVGEVMEMPMVAWAGRQVRLWNMICSIPFPVEEDVLDVRAESEVRELRAMLTSPCSYPSLPYLLLIPQILSFMWP
jgi:hypothetical protein